MANNTPKVHHPFVSYVLMATFIIQVLLVGFGVYPASSAETFITLIFFLEGAYLYRKQGFVGDKFILYASGMFQQTRIPYSVIKKVRLSSKKASDSSHTSAKENTINFIVTTDDGSEHALPITPRLVEQLKAHKIKVPKIKDISYFKLSYPMVDRLMVLEIIMLLVIWTTKLKNMSAISSEPIMSYNILQGIFGFFTGLLTVYFLHISTLRVTYSNKHIKVRGFAAVRQNVDIKQITKAQIKDRGPFREYLVYADQRRVLLSGYLSGIGVLFTLLQAYGAELVVPENNKQSEVKITEIKED